ncbi:hypothetical protein ILUMI_17976 [Ignelater luminosus]|uniref:Uncharacterized protein n=1 Tax=Ignelater luminosus TaxID=2038154 RepID=A0A8K0CN21_IGNLU|nr:hypothetical protein ILUMI_17976 [Ignelater luminosus]
MNSKIVWYLKTSRLNAIEIKNNMTGSGPVCSMIQAYYLSSRFKRDRDSIEGNPRPGRPTRKMQKIENIILQDRRIILWQIAAEMGFIKERMGKITFWVCLRRTRDGSPECWQRLTG